MISYLATAMMAIGVLASTAESAQWESDYGDALAETRSQENQPLLVVLDEPQADETSLEPALQEASDAKVADGKLLKHYRLCRIDASTKYGQKVAGVFKAKRFPHVAIIDKSGKVVLFKQTGKISTTQLTTALEKHQDGERLKAKTVSYNFSGDSAASSSSGYSNGSYCPSCQRNRW
jgi:hypothetical protein